MGERYDLPLTMLPSQSLNHASVGVINADVALPAANLHRRATHWEVELRQEYLCRCIFVEVV